MSSTSPCFLKVPARWPISETDVSQLQRCPTASLTVSWACAALAYCRNGRIPVAALTDRKLDGGLRLRRACEERSCRQHGGKGCLHRTPPGYFLVQATRSRGASLPPPSVRQLTVLGTTPS